MKHLLLLTAFLSAGCNPVTMAPSTVTVKSPNGQIVDTLCSTCRFRLDPCLERNLPADDPRCIRSDITVKP